MRDKGLYHINAVDELTQWEMVAAMPQIGNSTAAVYPLMANGDVPPVRLYPQRQVGGRKCATAKSVGRAEDIDQQDHERQFGQIQAANDPRILQLALKYVC